MFRYLGWTDAADMTDDEMAQAVLFGLTAHRATTCYCGREVMVHRRISSLECECGRKWRVSRAQHREQWRMLRKDGNSTKHYGWNMQTLNWPDGGYGPGYD